MKFHNETNSTALLDNLELPAEKTSEPEEPTTSEGEPPTSPRRLARILAILTVVLVGIGLFFWWRSQAWESTDDAQVDGHLNVVSARILGTTAAVYVTENQTVLVSPWSISTPANRRSHPHWPRLNTIKPLRS